MAPPHFLDETAYVSDPSERINRTDSQLGIYRSASLWLAAYLHHADRRFDAENPTHLFGSTYKAVKYDITFVDSGGNLLKTDSSLVIEFYKWLKQMGTGFEILLDGKKRVFSADSVDNINKFIQAEVQAQRLARGAHELYEKAFLAKFAPYLEVRARAAALSQGQKTAAPEDNLKGYDVKISRSQETQIALNLFGTVSHTADHDVTVHASQRLSVECGVRSQTNKTIACSSVAVHLYEQENVPNMYGIEVELKGEVTKGKAAGTSHFSGALPHINPCMSAPASFGWMQAVKYANPARFPDLSKGDQFRTPFFEEGTDRRVKDGKVLGVRDDFLSKAFGRITEGVGVSLPKGVCTHWNRHQAQNTLSTLGASSPDICKFLNGISAKDSSVTDRHYAKTPNVLNQLMLAGYGDDRAHGLATLTSTPQFLLARDHAPALLELCHLMLPLLVSEREKTKAYNENIARAADKFLDMVTYTITSFLVMCTQRARFYDGRTGRWDIDLNSEAIYIRFATNPMMAQFNHVFDTDAFKCLHTEMQVLENREAPMSPLRDSALVFSSIDREAAVAKLIESLQGELPDDKLALVARNASSILGGYLTQTAVKTVEVEFKERAVEPKDLSRCTDYKSVLSGWEHIKNNDKEHKGWRSHDDPKTKEALKKKLTRYRVLVDGFDAWAAANNLSTEAATAAIDARLAKREMTKVLAEFGSVLSAKRQRTE